MLTGCGTTVTHDSASYGKMSQQEAIQLVHELRIFDYNPSQPLVVAGKKGERLRMFKPLDASRRYSVIQTVDQDGINLNRAHLVLVDETQDWQFYCERRVWLSGNASTGGFYKNIIDYYGVGYTPQRVNFADISRIKLDRRPALIPGAPSTYAIYLYFQDGTQIFIDFSDHPNKHKEYLSALLELCPNVK